MMASSPHERGNDRVCKPCDEVVLRTGTFHNEEQLEDGNEY